MRQVRVVQLHGGHNHPEITPFAHRVHLAQEEVMFLSEKVGHRPDQSCPWYRLRLTHAKFSVARDMRAVSTSAQHMFQRSRAAGVAGLPGTTHHRMAGHAPRSAQRARYTTASAERPSDIPIHPALHRHLSRASAHTGAPWRRGGTQSALVGPREIES